MRRYLAMDVILPYVAWITESFALGTRVLVFDRPRVDPQAPDAFGATVTFNIQLKGRRAA